jgi:hypothetical protein
MKRWQRDAAKRSPVPWNVFRIHYEENSDIFNDDVFWYVFLTGFIAGGNS